MKDLWENFKNKLAYWMQGRYGNDELNNCIYITFIILWLLSLITKSSLLYYIGLALLCYAFFRSFSRNTYKRSQERLWFLKKADEIKRLPKKIKQRWEQRKTHKFYRCKQCGVTIRVPKGLGQVEITCPKCGYKFVDRT